ncbi:MAG: tail fiber domain-containing protein [Gloeotrichia echinulata HAB0833]
MANEPLPLKRNRYAYPPSQECKITGSNLNRDFDHYHLPHSRLALASLNDWGVAQGLEVTGIIGSTTLGVNSGVAFDNQGQLIWLADNGSGTLDINPPTKVSVPVQMDISKYQLSEDTAYYVTISFFEWEQREVGRPCDRVLEQVPWIRLQPISGDGSYVDDGTSIALGQVVIDAQGKLKELKTDCRRLVGKTVDQLNFQRADKVADQIQQVSAAKIRPAGSGGLQITVPNASDKVLLKKEGGGNFTKLEVQTDTLDVAGNIKASELLGTSLQLSSNGTIAGSLTIQNDLSVSRNADIKGNLKISGNLEVQGNVIVHDTEHIAGNVSLGDADNDEVKITGVVRSGHSSGALEVDDALHTTGSLTVDGNVGIGTTDTGTSKLKIANSQTDFADFVFSGSGMGQLQLIGWTGGWNINTLTDGKHLYLNRDAKEKSDVLIGRIGKELFVRGKDGNIGIGTSQPQGKLDIQGDIRAGNSDIYFTKTDHNHTGTGNTTGYAAIENAADHNALMILGRAGTSKGRYVKLWDYLQVNGGMEITGNVGIGKTNPWAALDVNGSIFISGGNGLQFYNSNNSQYWRIIPFWNDPNDPDLFFDFSGNPSTWVSGWLEPMGGGWKYNSDERLKQNVEPFGNVLEQVMQLNPKSYHWINAASNQKKSFGFIAQEVEKVFPEFVSEKRGYKALNYDNFAVLAIAAIREQQELLLQMTEEIAKLRDQKQQTSLA